MTMFRELQLQQSRSALFIVWMHPHMLRVMKYLCLEVYIKRGSYVIACSCIAEFIKQVDEKL